MDKASKKNYEQNKKKINSDNGEIYNQSRECEVGEDTTKYGE